MKKSYLSWNKDTVKDDVIFEHLYELSVRRKLNLLQSTEELLNTTDLLRTNKRVSNKIAPAGPPKFKVIRIPKWETKLIHKTKIENRFRFVMN
jgi:hypothetical protein